MTLVLYRCAFSISRSFSLRISAAALVFFASASRVALPQAGPVLVWADEVHANDNYAPDYVSEFFSSPAGPDQSVLFLSNVSPLHPGYPYWPDRLWASDGTTSGTLVLREFLGDYEAIGTENLALNGMVYFSANEVSKGLELWKTDGTVEGTQLVKDIYPGHESGLTADWDWGWWGPGFCDSYFTKTDHAVFFFANDGIHGRELWKTDGTESGTLMVKDVWPGEMGKFSHLNDSLAGLADKVYIFAADEEELWVSDGTDSGTVLLKSGVSNPGLGNEFLFTVANDKMFFTAGLHGSGQYDLWITDGTEVGTVSLKRFLEIHQYAPIGGILYFTAEETSESGQAFWRSDGTENGTYAVKSLPPLLTPTRTSYACSALTNMDGLLLFHVAESYIELPSGRWVYDGNLWKSDGTADGTVPVTRSTLSSVDPEDYTHFVFNGEYYFRGADGEGNAVMWKSDGTESGTVRVAHLDHLERPQVVNDLLYFFGPEPWVSDGTPEGTRLLKETMPRGNGLLSADERPRDGLESGMAGRFTPLGDSGRFCFVLEGKGLYSSDGTETGTGAIWNFGGCSKLHELNGQAVFAAETAQVGDTRKLWKTDGTSAGTEIVKDVTPWSADEDSDTLGPWIPGPDSGSLLFPGGDGAHGWELWKTDGTESGTMLVNDLFPGEEGARWDSLTKAGDTLFFSTKNPNPNPADPFADRYKALWKADSSGQNAVMLDLIEDAFATIKNITPVGQKVFYTGEDWPHGIELWASDGTPEGTGLVKDIIPGSRPYDEGYGSYPESFVDLRGKAVFWSNLTPSKTHPQVNGIISSNGTAAGTIRVIEVRDPLTYDYDTIGRNLFVMGDYGFFRAEDNEGMGTELWITDGSGARLVREIMPGPCGSNPHHFSVIGNRLLFVANDGVHGYEPWISDGTYRGTQMIADLTPGAAGSTPAGFSLIGDQVYFFACNYESPNTDGLWTMTADWVIKANAQSWTSYE